MSVPDYTKFGYVNKFGQYNIIGQLEDNLKSFFDYAFLSIGAFTNVSSANTSLYGGSFHTLNSVSDPSYTDNTVYETVRKDWVWDSGVVYSGVSPVNISGVYVNDVLIPAPTGNVTYPYHLDYNQGRVVFSNPLSSSDTVKMNYSYRNVQVYKGNESDWFKDPVLIKVSGDEKALIKVDPNADDDEEEEKSNAFELTVMEDTPHAKDALDS